MTAAPRARWRAAPIQVTIADPTLSARTAARVSSNAIFGRVMGLVALTVAFAAAGIWIGRELSGWQCIFLFLLQLFARR